MAKMRQKHAMHRERECVPGPRAEGTIESFGDELEMNVLDPVKLGEMAVSFPATTREMVSSLFRTDVAVDGSAVRQPGL